MHTAAKPLFALMENVVDVAAVRRYFFSHGGDSVLASVAQRLLGQDRRASGVLIACALLFGAVRQELASFVLCFDYTTENFRNIGKNVSDFWQGCIRMKIRRIVPCEF